MNNKTGFYLHTYVFNVNSNIVFEFRNLWVNKYALYYLVLCLQEFRTIKLLKEKTKKKILKGYLTIINKCKEYTCKDNPELSNGIPTAEMKRKLLRMLNQQ